MGLFNKSAKGSKNWQQLNKQSFQEQSKNRDVHSTQNLERGEIGEVTKPIRAHILSVFLAALFAGMAYVAAAVVVFLFTFYTYIVESQGASLLGFDPTAVTVNAYWQVWVWVAFVFAMAWLIFNQKLMMTHKSSNSMVDSTDINSYENDQRVMLPEEIQRDYDWFPDTGAHSSVQVSSLLSHFMLSKKGLKQIEVSERYAEDGEMADGTPYFKGELVYDDNGMVVKSKMPMIDEAFGQDLFTASDIPVSEKAIRKPLEVKGIDYNPKDETGNRKDRDKQGYDTITELINKDWEFPEYEVQRPAGAYIVDTAPVNTMVLAITV